MDLHALRKPLNTNTNSQGLLIRHNVNSNNVISLSNNNDNNNNNNNKQS